MSRSSLVDTGWKRGHCEAELLAPRRKVLKAISVVHTASTPKEGLEAEIISLGRERPANSPKQVIGCAARSR